MSTTLKTTIGDDVKNAMRARDRERLAALRQITAAIKQQEVDSRTDLDDAGVLGVLNKMLKQRRDSLEQFTAAGRDDLAAKESFEIQTIEQYMPQPLSDAEVDAAIGETIAQTGAQSMRDMGKVMGQLKSAMEGRADLAKVSQLVKARLSGG